MERKQLDGQTWIFEEGGVRFFLLTGSERALLIDSGMAARNARELARELTDLPLELLNTHADRDHMGSNGEFPEFYMHPSEYINFYKKGGEGISAVPVPVWDGSVLELGGRSLRIVALPGHTPGSIAVLDEKNRRLFSGDPVQDGRIFMFGEMRQMNAYVHSLRRLLSMAGQFDEIYPSHGSCPVGPEIIPRLIDAAEQILAGKARGQAEEMFGQRILAYPMGPATFLCDEDGGGE